jgi:hypothetical protein
VFPLIQSIAVFSAVLLLCCTLSLVLTREGKVRETLFSLWFLILAVWLGCLFALSFQPMIGAIRGTS